MHKDSHESCLRELFSRGAGGDGMFDVDGDAPLALGGNGDADVDRLRH